MTDQKSSKTTWQEQIELRVAEAKAEIAAMADAARARINRRHGQILRRARERKA